MRPASVYARAVSNTPGPVSVSETVSATRQIRRTVSLDLDAHLGRDLVEIVEVILVQGRAQKRVSVV